MSDVLFGPIAVVAWILASLVFVFCATWIWQIVHEAKGLFGTALATIFTCLAVVCVCFGFILMRQPWVPSWVLGAIVSAVFPPMVFAALILTDLYAASRNSHRSFTSRSYQAYRGWADSKKDRDFDRLAIVRDSKR